jgi:WD40 repeat protein
MAHLKNSIYLICIICIVSCTINTSINYDRLIDKFPKVIILKGIELKVPPIVLNPDNLRIVDSFMIITQSRSDSIFSFFRIPDGKYLMSFGNRGKGPNEFLTSFQYVTLAPVYCKSSTFAVGNMMTTIRYYKISDIINKDLKPFRVENLPPELNRFRSIAYVSDSLILGAPYRGNFHLFKFNTNTKVLESFRNYPDKYPLLDIEIKRDVYGCSMAVKPDNSKLVVAYANTGKIEIYDLTNGKYITMIYKGIPSLEENTGLNKDSKFWYHNPEEIVCCRKIATTNKYIYIDVFNDHYSKIFNNDGPNRTYIPEIHVFDWAGNPITKINLTNYYRYFDVDMIDKYLYAIDDNIEDRIFQYDLTKALPGQK